MRRIVCLLFAMPFIAGAFCEAAPSYSDVVTVGDFLYVSGQVPIDPKTGKMVQGDVEMLTNLVIDRIQHLLHVKGYKMSQVVQTQVYLTDVRDYDAMDAAYSARFNFQYPPARDVTVASDLVNNAALEISCIAYKNR